MECTGYVIMLSLQTRIEKLHIFQTGDNSSALVLQVGIRLYQGVSSWNELGM